jgi:hypothetical protein
LLLIHLFLPALTVLAAYGDAMPNLTVTHEAPLELIKQHPALAVDLLRELIGVPFPDGMDVRLASTSLNTVAPTQYSADSVVVVSDPVTRNPLIAIVVEPQGRDEKTKKFSWPIYLSNVRKEVGCESAFLIVVCPDPTEADKCRAVIRMGHPGLELWPIVIDPKHAPGDEGASPYLLLFLACLPALNLEDPKTARRVLAAIRDTGASVAERNTLSTIILVRATEAARSLLEGLMSMTEWKSDFIESFVEKGREQGLEQGLEQGRIQDKREDVLKVLDLRNLRPTEEQRARVDASTDLAQLGLWFERSVTAATADEVFTD